MRKNHNNQKNILFVLINYLLLVGFLGLGGYLYVRYPENEILGGMVLGSTGVILGIIVPYHLKRTQVVEFQFLPSKGEIGRIILYTAIFTAILVLAAGRKEFMMILKNPPKLLPAVFTFLFLLLSAITYALLFWGGILHVFRKAYGSIAAVLITGALFSLYHIAEFAFTPLTWQFLLLMFIGGVLCSSFTLLIKSVLPTMIAQQIGQFLYFVSLEDNPFSEPDGVIATGMLLLICSGVYMVIFRKRTITER
jgi:membrane protease YdiL (CAAX protease family)